MKTSETFAVSEEGLDSLLQIIIRSHGYEKVLDHLQRIGPEVGTPTPRKAVSARVLLKLPLEERDRILEAAAAAALPAYEADRALPPDQRVLTADWDTGDGLEDEADNA